MVKIYRKKRYSFISLTETGLLSLFFSFSLQSCNSTGVDRLNMHLNRSDLLRENLLERRERNIQEGRRITAREENQP